MCTNFATTEYIKKLLRSCGTSTTRENFYTILGQHVTTRNFLLRLSKDYKEGYAQRKYSLKKMSFYIMAHQKFLITYVHTMGAKCFNEVI